MGVLKIFVRLSHELRYPTRLRLRRSSNQSGAKLRFRVIISYLLALDTVPSDKENSFMLNSWKKVRAICHCDIFAVKNEEKSKTLTGDIFRFLKRQSD